MSGSGSEEHERGEDFVESDKKETWLPYGHGGVPFYVALIWLTFLVGYVTYMFKFALPDFSLWLEY